MPVARSVRLSEIDEAVDVAVAAFEVTPEGDNEWRSGWHRHAEQQGLDHILVAEHGGRIVSSMVLHSQPMWMGDAVIPSAAVAGVGTLPDARRLGGAAAMLTETVHRLKSWGAVSSPMWPFSFRYYRKFGWEIGGEVRETEWDRDVEWQIPADGEVAPVTATDIPDLAAIWDEDARSHRCGSVRSQADWEDMVTRRGGDGARPDRGGFLCRQNGEAAGYIFYTRPTAKEGDDAPPLDIAEIRARNAGADLALLQAVADANPDYPTFKANFPSDHRLRSVVVDPRALETDLAASFGFRIIHPGPIFTQMQTAARVDPVTWRLIDKVLGVSTWEVPLNGGPAQSTSVEPDITCNIETFAQIAGGYLKPEQAARANLLQGDHHAIAAINAATKEWGQPYRSNLESG